MPRTGTRGLLAGVAGAAAMLGLRVGLGYAFDLVFHFHPALVGAVAGWSARRRLDPVPALVLVSAVGLAVGLWIVVRT